MARPSLARARTCRGCPTATVRPRAPRQRACAHGTPSRPCRPGDSDAATTPGHTRTQHQHAMPCRARSCGWRPPWQPGSAAAFRAGRARPRHGGWLTRTVAAAGMARRSSMAHVAGHGPERAGWLTAPAAAPQIWFSVNSVCLCQRTCVARVVRCACALCSGVQPVLTDPTTHLCVIPRARPATHGGLFVVSAACSCAVNAVWLWECIRAEDNRQSDRGWVTHLRCAIAPALFANGFKHMCIRVWARKSALSLRILSQTRLLL